MANDKDELVTRCKDSSPDIMHFLLEVIKRYDLYISATHAKASLIIALNSLIMGAVVLQYDKILSLYKTATLKAVVDIFLVAIFCIGLISILVMFSVVYPLFKDTEKTANQHSPIYFDSVSQASHSEYCDRVIKASHDDLIRDLSTQTSILARILSGKMPRMRWSMYAAIIELILILIILIIHAFA